MILELSGEFSVKTLCEHMDISRSSFYYWKNRLNNPSVRNRNFISNILLFKEYHERYPSHGYRWLNAKVRLDTGLVVSDVYAHKCCKTAGIKSKSKHYKYKKAGTPCKVYPNLLLSELNVTGPMQCVVSDMTAFYVKGIYYELTIYMDLWNNEILSHSLSSKRGDRMTYISGLESLIEFNIIRFLSMRVQNMLTSAPHGVPHFCQFPRKFGYPKKENPREQRRKEFQKLCLRVLAYQGV